MTTQEVLAAIEGRECDTLMVVTDGDGIAVLDIGRYLTTAYDIRADLSFVLQGKALAFLYL